MSQIFPTVSDYVDALCVFLTANTSLFPPKVLQRLADEQFDKALKIVVQRVIDFDGTVVDNTLDEADRAQRWAAAAAAVEAANAGKQVAAGLSADALNVELVNGHWVDRINDQFGHLEITKAFDLPQAARLATILRFCEPGLVTGSTGLVVMGYGDSEIFPSYRHVSVQGHVGQELYCFDDGEHVVTHDGPPLIKGLAQTSMIDMFTDGFGFPLWRIVNKSSVDAMSGILVDLAAAGVVLDPVVADRIVGDRHTGFMKEWVRQNWKDNFHPLVEVVSTLDVAEMAHLAETLLVLQSLKERVTSSSESVGGPIDVAAITKNEGLVWIKRKHFFDPAVNSRYVARQRSSLRE